MTKNEAIYVCNECGNESAGWSGKCLVCGAWNTLKQIKIQSQSSKSKSKIVKNSEIITLEKVEDNNNERIMSKINEFDRVLGGGIVAGTVMLLGGDPGIGKSTLMIKLASNIDDVIYVSGEESASQIKLRAKRLDINLNKIRVLIETDVDLIIEKISQHKSKLLIIDSIQTMYDSSYPSTPGSVVQVRECALKLQQFAKSKNIAILLVGHVTKDGNVAGPRTLEHLVDVMLYLEGDRYQGTRILRGIKNRFGATDEIGVFEMTDKGLCEQKNLSKLFINDTKNISGNALTVAIEGTRPFVVEIQALTIPSNFGYPKRTASGFDLNRLNLLLAVLVKRAGLNLSNHDIYLNIAGGYKLKDPGADLAVAAAIASAFKNKSIRHNLCLFGEVGLSGEIRKVTFEKKRIEEAKRLGYNIPKQTNYINEILNNIFI